MILAPAASRGSTALLPALEEAVKILDGRPGDCRSRMGFIFVITDGEDASEHTYVERAVVGAHPWSPTHSTP
ncbi:unnamed protein product [Urochloa humidicola]